MISILGDAELDEGNIYEAMLEGWKKDLKNTWWIIDFNRQSLDAVINDDLYQRILDFFESVGWQVVTLKYGKLQLKAFEGPAGGALKKWIDECPNQLYSALIFKGGAAWRQRLSVDLKDAEGLDAFLDNYNDEQLSDLMSNLGGHDMESIVEAFEAVKDDQPRCFVAYTVKGYGLPLAGHKDNHAGMITPAQMTQFMADKGINEGEQWSTTHGIPFDEQQVQQFYQSVPYNQRPAPKPMAAPIEIETLNTPSGDISSTQLAFGKIMNQIASSKAEYANRIVTTSPDVASSTNLSAWVNKRGVYHGIVKEDTFKNEQIASTLKWLQSPKGQHIELGIAESNLFSLLTSLGQAEKHFGTRLLPIGTVYDPFICRGLDTLNYGCYQDARFMLVATPSGISLAPEGGAHQSFNTQLIGMAQPNLLSFEPAYSDELAAIMQWSLGHMQAPDGSSVYLRLSTKTIDQPKRSFDDALKQDVIKGAYWYHKPQNDCPLAIIYMGVVGPEALKAYEQIKQEMPGVGLLSVTSSDRLYSDWQKAKTARQQGNKQARAHIEQLLMPLAANAGLVTVVDAHPAGLTWIAGVLGHRVEGLGLTQFGQSGDSIDLYQHYRIDADAILDACAASCLNIINKG